MRELTKNTRPNVIFIFADQWRGQAVGYVGDPNVKTPNIDLLAQESIVFSNSISGCPVCSPYRASLLTGQYPLSHGVFLNDVRLDPNVNSLGKIYKQAGYTTAYIGKWHIDGSGNRSGFIPAERRQGFDFWKVLDCTHKYMNSEYWDNDNSKKKWDGYDMCAQTDAATNYINNTPKNQPFFLMLSFGPPHNPYDEVPRVYKKKFKKRKIKLRPNVPKSTRRRAKKTLAGYYAHILALDDCVKKIIDTLSENSLYQDSLLVITSDHGDMHGSHGGWRKQWPYEESIRIPLLIHCPKLFGNKQIERNFVIDVPDLLPTLLGLAHIEIPDSIEGKNYAESLLENIKVEDLGKLIQCIWPFSEWSKEKGGREYRGIRTERYTYVKTLNGPWLLFDNKNDPYQRDNLVDNPNYIDLQNELDQKLNRLLEERNDSFKEGEYYLDEFNYHVNPRDGSIPYSNR